MSIPPALPRSASSLGINMVGVVCYALLIYIILVYYPAINVIVFTVLALLSIILPIVALEFKLLKSWNFVSFAKQTLDNERVRVKTTGLYGTILVIGLCYLIFPEYHHSFYSLYCAFIVITGMVIFMVGFIYIDITEKWNPQKQDGLWQAGLLFSFRFSEINKIMLAEHCRVWLVKAFFLPLMFSDLAVRYNFFTEGKLYLSGYYVGNGLVLYNSLFNNTPFKLFTFIQNIMVIQAFFWLTVEVLFATAGYICTFRWMGCDIKSTDTSLFGWVICLCCYAPFIGLLHSAYIPFGGDTDWHSGLEGYPVLSCCYGIVVITTQILYSLTLVNMGLRFSNLTYRGVITSGLYRYSKHPMYILKSINWFLVSMPFISGDGWLASLYGTSVFILLWLVYYWRARTEENHLSHYPEYVQYANWMNAHGILRNIGQWIPYLRYSEARAKKSGTEVWWNKHETL